MKVVLIGKKGFDSLEYNLCDSFIALGHEAIVLDYNDISLFSPRAHYWITRFSEKYDKWVHERLAERVVAEQPDLVVGVYRHIHPSLVSWLKRRLKKIPIIQINPDALTNLERQQVIASDYDYLFTKEPYMVEFLRQKAGLNAYYLPEGFNPRIHRAPALDKKTAEDQTNIDVLIFGSLYPYRARIINKLVSANIRPAIYGMQGPYCPPEIKSLFRNQYLVGEQKSDLLYGAKIVFNNFHYAEVTSANQKYFEIYGAGGFQLCDYKPVLDEYTSVSSDQYTYQSIEEAIEKIRYYLENETARHAIAQQQHIHFQQYHTFDRRIRQLLKIVGM